MKQGGIPFAAPNEIVLYQAKFPLDIDVTFGVLNLTPLWRDLVEYRLQGLSSLKVFACRNGWRGIPLFCG